MASAGHAPPLKPSLIAANQQSILNQRGGETDQLVSGMPRGLRVGTMGVEKSQSTALGANSEEEGNQ